MIQTNKKAKQVIIINNSLVSGFHSTCWCAGRWRKSSGAIRCQDENWSNRWGGLFGNNGRLVAGNWQNCCRRKVRREELGTLLKKFANFYFRSWQRSWKCRQKLEPNQVLESNTILRRAEKRFTCSSRGLGRNWARGWSRNLFIPTRWRKSSAESVHVKVWRWQKCESSESVKVYR